MYTPEQQQWIIAEANKRAIAKGTSVAAEIAAEAQKSGMDMATAERNMGYPAGTLGGAPQTATMGANTSNLGMGGANSPATPGTPYRLDDTTRASIVSQAEARAKASGLTREQELYKYAQGEGINDAGVDTYMGFDPGTTAKWAQTGMTPTVTGGGAAGGAAPVRSTDNRWSGDPTRQPDGSFNPSGNTRGYGGGGNLGMGDTAYQRNPYLDAAARDVGSNMFDQWKRNVAPGIRSNAMATGGYGGSRQGVVEANSMNDLGRNYSSALTNMYGQDYTNFQNRGIQRQGQAQSYDLGLRSNDLGFAGLDANIAQNNFGNQLQAANFGMGVQDYLNRNNQTGIAAGTQINNAPWDYQKYLNTAGNQAGSGWNSNTTTKTGG